MTKLSEGSGAMRVFKVGEVLILEKGEYSDFRYLPPLRILIEFNTREIVEVFNMALKLAGKDPDADYGSHGVDEFHAWLLTSGHCEDVDYHEWHTGSYGDDVQPEGEK